jgi:hypothetical protein
LSHKERKNQEPITCGKSLLKKSLAPPEGNCPQESGAYEAADSHIEMEDAFIRKEKNIIPPKAARAERLQGKMAFRESGPTER